MPKQEQKKSNVHTAVPETRLSPISAKENPEFSGGELGQLQEILFGAQQRTNNEQLVNLQEQLSQQIQTMGNMLSSRINQLTESVESISRKNEQKITELQQQQETMRKSIESSMNEKQTKLESSISLLAKNAGAETSKLQDEVNQMEASLKSELRDSHKSLETQMGTATEKLQNNKLDRHNLAQLLGQVSEQLTASDSSN